MAQADRISLRKFIPTAIFDSNRSSFQYMDVAFAKVCIFLLFSFRGLAPGRTISVAEQEPCNQNKVCFLKSEIGFQMMINRILTKRRM